MLSNETKLEILKKLENSENNVKKQMDEIRKLFANWCTFLYILQKFMQCDCTKIV